MVATTAPVTQPRPSKNNLISLPSNATLNSNNSSSSSGRLKIKPPTTTNDTGEPTNSCYFDARRVLRLIEDERFLSAQELYNSVRERLDEAEEAVACAEAEFDDDENEVGKENYNNTVKKFKKSYYSSRRSNKKKSTRTLLNRQKNATKANENDVKARQVLDDNEDILKKMEDRCRLFLKAKKNLDVNDDWTLAQTLFGVTTYYRKESDGSLSVKLEGLVNDASLFDQVAIIREADLYSLWQPFVTSSVTVAHLDKLDTVGWFVVGLPSFGLMRDACFRAIGCDSIYEDGSIMVVAAGISDRPEDEGSSSTQKKTKRAAAAAASLKFDSITNSVITVSDFDDAYEEIESIRKEPILDTLDLPSPPTRLGGGRLTIRSFSAQIHVESPTSAMTKMVANIDPNLHFIPQPLLDFIMKRVCGVILYKMQGAARNISKDPITNLHAIRIREDKEFYKGFLLPKFKGICKIRGWQMPPISAFELSDAQLEMADVFINKQKYKSEMKAIRLFHANGDSKLDEFLESSTSAAEENSASRMNDGPKVRTIPTDSDDVSDISKSTASSFWRSNRIANYRREVEERTQRRKLREIQEARERAAARLKPKSLNEDAITRLNELRKARDRHKSKDHQSQLTDDDGNTACIPRGGLAAVQQDEEPSELDGTGRKWKISLSSHDFFTKIFVVQFLIAFLFCLLYMDAAFDKVVAFRGDSFWMERGRDLATIFYLAFTGWVHFTLCYVALLYAFSTLQIGSIAGKRTRMFYSLYVHWIVASVSVCMLGLGIVKPFVVKFFQWIVWNIYSGTKIAKIYLISVTSSKVLFSFEKTISAICSVVSSTRILFLESNILGRVLVSTTKLVFGFVLRSFRYPFSTFTDITIQRYEGTLETLAWREDTFFTTRALLSHSSFFLLVLLLLFNLTANKARKTIHVDGESATAT